jgi:hypothetical protein
MTAGFLAANEQMGMEYRDVWTAAYINNLPDSAFLYVGPDGTRHFPVKDANGKPDAAHIRNALARIPQATSIPPAARATAMAKAKKLAAAHADIGSGPGQGYEGSAGSGRSRLERGDGTVETRTFGLAVELRADGDGRTLVGRAVPYGHTVELPGGGRERFLPGAFNAQLASNQIGQVRIYDSHSSRQSSPVGTTKVLADRPDGLYGEWRISDTTRGNDALELVRSGEVTGLSIGFKALGNRKAADGATERVAAHLDHVALTYEPVYETAQVTAVRAVPPSRPLDAYRGDLLRARGILARL